MLTAIFVHSHFSLIYTYTRSCIYELGFLFIWMPLISVTFTAELNDQMGFYWRSKEINSGHVSLNVIAYISCTSLIRPWQWTWLQVLLSIKNNMCLF